MTELMERVKGLAELELRDANDKHPQFHSLHEGYAVLMEEIEEATEALDELKAMQRILWAHVRRDYVGMAYRFAARTAEAAEKLAAEAVQCAAMAKKMTVYIDKEPSP